MGWDNERYPRTKKDSLHISFISFISFGISHSKFSDFGIFFLVLGCSRDVPKTSKDTPGISSTWSYPWPILEISHRYPKTSRFILWVGIPDVVASPHSESRQLGPPVSTEAVCSLSRLSESFRFSIVLSGGCGPSGACAGQASH
jgi:hypothetical protein